MDASTIVPGVSVAVLEDVAQGNHLVLSGEITIRIFDGKKEALLWEGVARGPIYSRLGKELKYAIDRILSRPMAVKE